MPVGSDYHLTCTLEQSFIHHGMHLVEVGAKDLFWEKMSSFDILDGQIVSPNTIEYNLTNLQPDDADLYQCRLKVPGYPRAVFPSKREHPNRL